MARPRTHGNPSTRVAAAIVIGMIAMVAIPAAVTLHSVSFPGTLSVGPEASPHGYTWSLLLFIVPIVGIAFWFLPSEGLEIPQRAFWRTIGILGSDWMPAGCDLRAVVFYLSQSQGDPGHSRPGAGAAVPIEEYIFYLTGFITVLLLYVWLSEYWLAAYTVLDYEGEARASRRLLQFHPTSVVLGVALIAVAVLYKRWFSPVPRAGRDTSRSCWLRED